MSSTFTAKRGVARSAIAALDVVIRWSMQQNGMCEGIGLASVCSELWNVYKENTYTIVFDDDIPPEKLARFLAATPLVEWVSYKCFPPKMTVLQANLLLEKCVLLHSIAGELPFSAAKLFARRFDALELFVDGSETDFEEVVDCKLEFIHVLVRSNCMDVVAKVLLAFPRVPKLTLEVLCSGVSEASVVRAVPDWVETLRLSGDFDGYGDESELAQCKAKNLSLARWDEERKIVDLARRFPNAEEVECQGFESVVPSHGLRILKGAGIPRGSFHALTHLDAGMRTFADLVTFSREAPNVESLTIWYTASVSLRSLETMFPKLRRVSWRGHLLVDGQRVEEVEIGKQGTLDPSSTVSKIVVGFGAFVHIDETNSALKEICYRWGIGGETLRRLLGFQTLQVERPMKPRDCVERLCSEFSLRADLEAIPEKDAYHLRIDVKNSSFLIQITTWRCPQYDCMRYKGNTYEIVVPFTKM